METQLRAGKGSVYDMLRKVNTYFVPEAQARLFSADWSLFDNVNTREEYEEMAGKAGRT